MTQSCLAIPEQAYARIAVSAAKPSQLFRAVVMIIEQFVDSSTAFTGCSSGRLRIVFLQLTEDGFTVIDTCAASAHIVLFASLGNAFLHFVVRCHDVSALAASALRHLAFCSA